MTLLPLAFVLLATVAITIKQTAIYRRRMKAGKAMYLAGLKPLPDDWMPRNVVKKEYIP